jgi:metal-responsive CopG/Arc/MetJ family transcriptional regulator
MKVAVSIPDRIFEAAERLAKQRRVPRSQIFAEALAAYVETRESDAVTSKLNEIYAHEASIVDVGLMQAQNDSIDHEAW